MTKAAASPIAIVLNAVLATVEDGQPKSLCVKRGDGFGLPYGPFDPARHRTFELGLRSWVAEQTRVNLGYVEQLYTFGDKGRESPAAVIAGGDSDARIVSVGYLALAPEPAKVAARDAQWRGWYEFFPWEDWRNGRPGVIDAEIAPRLRDWAQAAPERRAMAGRPRQCRAVRTDRRRAPSERRSAVACRGDATAGKRRRAYARGSGRATHASPPTRDARRRVTLFLQIKIPPFGGIFIWRKRWESNPPKTHGAFLRV